MAQTVFLPQTVVDRFSELIADLEKLEFEFKTFSEEAGILQTIAQTEIHLLILSTTASPSAFDLVRSIRENSEKGAEMRILLITEDRPGVREEAKVAGFDAVEVEPLTNVRLLETILHLTRSHGQPDEPDVSEESKRVATRVDFSGPVNFVFRGKQKSGWGINASRSGMLFATDEDIPQDSAVVIRFELPNGKKLDLGASCVRCEQLDSQIENFTLAIGVKFLRLREADRDLLDLLLEARGMKAAEKLTPEFIRELIDHGEAILSQAFKKEINPTGLAIYLKEVGLYEREAFTIEGEVEAMIRRLVAHRVQCYAFRLFLPAIKAKGNNVDTSIISDLGQLIERADAIETEVEAWVKDLAHQGKTKNRQELNESSNRLYHAKTKLLYAADEILSGSSLGQDPALLKISQRVGTLEKLRERRLEQMRFSRRSSPAAPSKGMPTKRKKGGFRFPWVGLLKFALIAGAVGLGTWLWRGYTPNVTRSELNVPFRVDNTVVEGKALVIQVQWSIWKNLPHRARNQLLGNAQELLIMKNLLQARVIDEQGGLLAEIISVQTPSGREYSRRHISRLE